MFASHSHFKLDERMMLVIEKLNVFISNCIERLASNTQLGRRKRCASKLLFDPVDVIEINVSVTQCVD